MPNKMPFPEIILPDGRKAYVVHDPMVGEIIIPLDNPVALNYVRSKSDPATRDFNDRWSREPIGGC